MRFPASLGLAAMLLLGASSGTRAAEPRIALVMGNGAYDTAPLANPPNDAKLMAGTLARLGFEVIERRDGDQATMKRAIQEFGARLERAGPAAIGLFFYAGHGVQLNGRNYLIPTRARIERDSDLEIEAVSADWVLEQMRYARNRLNLVILDACRNNPFARSFRSADRGLAKMDAPAGVLIAYSTAPGDVAADGNSRNSPYTEALARAVGEPNLPVEQVFKRTRIAVLGATAGRQTPWESSSLTGDFYFAGGVGAAGASARTQASRRRPPHRRRPPAAPRPASGTRRSPSGRACRTAGTRRISRLTSRSIRAGVFAGLARARLAGLPPKRAAPDADVCSLPVGRWKTSGNNIPVEGEVAIQADRTVAWWKGPGDRLPAVSGTWSCDPAARRFVFTWGHGSVDTLTLSADGRTLQGENQLGIQIRQTRLR